PSRTDGPSVDGQRTGAAIPNTGARPSPRAPGAALRRGREPPFASGRGLTAERGPATVERRERLAAEGERLAGQVAQGDMSSTAYDTAWVARLREPDGRPAFPAAAAWLRERQQADGSWGGPIALPHDRVISTLAAIVALAEAPVGDSADAGRVA